MITRYQEKLMQEEEEELRFEHFFRSILKDQAELCDILQTDDESFGWLVCLLEHAAKIESEKDWQSFCHSDQIDWGRAFELGFCARKLRSHVVSLAAERARILAQR
jgi:hypothetical protein